MSEFTADPSNFPELLQMVKDGNAIALKPGEYKGPFAIDKSITIVGAGEDTAIFAADEPALTVKVPGVRLENLALERTVGGDRGEIVLFAEPDTMPILHQVRLKGIAANVEWEGASWDIPAVIDFQEIETNRRIERSWQMQLGDICLVICDLDWLQVRGDRLSPGFQNLEIVLNSQNILPGTNLSGFIFLEAPDCRRQIEVSATIIAPIQVSRLQAESSDIPPVRTTKGGLNSQDWGYRFKGLVAEKFIRNFEGESAVDRYPEYKQRCQRAEELMLEVLGTEAHLFYVRRQAPARDAAEEIWELTLASDRADVELPEILQQQAKTLSFRAAVNKNGSEGLQVLSVYSIPLHRGEENEFGLACLIRLLPEHQYRRGVPRSVLVRMAKMDFISDRLPTEDQLQAWTTFVQIEQRIAEKRQFCVPFLSHNYGTATRKITLEIDITSATLDGNSGTALDEDDFRRRLFQARNQEIVLFETSPDGRSQRDGEKLGAIAEIDWQENKIRVMLDSELEERLAKGYYQLPATGFLSFVDAGELAQIKRKKDALKDLQNGRAQNPYLGEFFFDVTCARSPQKPVKLLPQDLLLPSANPQQIAAVETVLAVPDLALIQGPPGTGKTTVIAEICYQVARRGGRTLIASQANLAVDNALSRLVHNPLIRALRKGKAEKVAEEGEAFLEDRVIGTWLKNTADDCESDLQGRRERLELFQVLLANRERFTEYLKLELDGNHQQQELSERQIAIEANIKVLETEIAELKTQQAELKPPISGLDSLLNSAPDIDWKDSEVTDFLPRLQPYTNNEETVKTFLENVRQGKKIAAELDWEIPASGAFGLAAWLRENVAVSLGEFRLGLDLAKMAVMAMSATEKAVQVYRRNHGDFQKLKTDYQQRVTSYQSRQQTIENLEAKKAEIDLVVSEVGVWLNTGERRLYETLKQCCQQGLAFGINFLDLPGGLLAIARSMNLQILPDYGNEAIDKMPDWRLLEKALTGEATLGFKNVQGKKYRFDEFMQMSFSQPPMVLSESDRPGWQKIAQQFIHYERLSPSQRRSAINNTHLFLSETEHKYGAAWEPQNIEATLNFIAQQMFNTILNNARQCLNPVKTETEQKLQDLKKQLASQIELISRREQQYSATKEQVANFLEEADKKYEEFTKLLRQIIQQENLPQQLRNLAQEYLEMKASDVLKQTVNFSQKIESWESNIPQMEALIPALKPLEILSFIKDLLQSKQDKIVEKIKFFSGQIGDLQTEIVEIDKVIEEPRSPELIAERTWWESAWQEIPDSLKPEKPATGLFTIDFLKKIQTQFEKWQQELEREQAYLNRCQNFTKDWIEKLRQPSEKESNDLRRTYLDNANVIGITCVQAARRDFAEEFNKFDVVIIDEVSKCTPPEILIPALKGKKLVLVGDHRQLPPMLNDNTIGEIAEEMQTSKEELSFLEESLFKIHFETASAQIKQMLTTQYRMHPNIMAAINQFYDRRLQCGIIEPDKQRAHNLGSHIIEDKHHIIWVKMPETGAFAEHKEGTSPFNESEIDAIEKLCLQMEKTWSAKVAEGLPKKELGIITFYNAQLRRIEEKIDPEKFPSLHIRTGTVDRFQGMEREIIIVSMVRNNQEGKVGFANKPERVNVAFSRARELLIIIGCHSLFTQHPGKVGSMYSEVSNVVRRQGGIIDVSDLG